MNTFFSAKDRENIQAILKITWNKKMIARASIRNLMTYENPLELLKVGF